MNLCLVSLVHKWYFFNHICKLEFEQHIKLHILNTKKWMTPCQFYSLSTHLIPFMINTHFTSCIARVAHTFHFLECCIICCLFNRLFQRRTICWIIFQNIVQSENIRANKSEVESKRISNNNVGAWKSTQKMHSLLWDIIIGARTSKSILFFAR